MPRATDARGVAALMRAPELPFALTDKVALVTGAGRGLGRAIAVALARAGADVVIVSRTTSELEQTAQLIRDAGRSCLAATADVAQEDDVVGVATAALKRFGRVDLLVNNAGNMLFKPLVPLPDFAPPGLPEFRSAVSDDEWASVQGTHVGGALHLLRALGPQMLERQSGTVIIVSSLSAVRPARFMVAYDTAKGALITLTRSLAREWARYGVTVNCIAPGQFPTEMTREVHTTPQGQAWLRKRVPMRHAGDPQDVGLLTVYLTSDAARYITGQVICIDGGESLG